MRRATNPTWGEAFRMAGAGLLAAVGDSPNRVVMVTSAGRGEGRTTVCAGLARALGQTGCRVAAVDLDLRRPGLHQRLGAVNDAGVAEALTGVKGLPECLQTVSITPGRDAPNERTLSVLAAGQPPSDPASLYSRDRLQTMLEKLAAEADLVLVDTPPLLSFADGLLVGACSAGALVVVQERATKAASLDQVDRSLRQNGIRALGLVFNQERR